MYLLLLKNRLLGGLFDIFKLLVCYFKTRNKPPRELSVNQ